MKPTRHHPKLRPYGLADYQPDTEPTPRWAWVLCWCGALGIVAVLVREWLRGV